MADYTGVASDTLIGTNQELKQGTKHFMPVTARSNKVQAGQIPRTQSGPVGPASHSKPLGNSKSLES